MLIVPDTNVFISAQLQPRGNEATIFTLWQQRFIQFAFSEDILAEYRRVLFYPHIQDRVHWTAERIDTFITALRAGSLLLTKLPPVQHGARDPSDNKFLACAVAANAQVVVSGDEKHLQPLKNYQGIPIVSPRQFLEQYIFRQQAA